MVMGPITGALEERDANASRAIAAAEKAGADAEKARADVEVALGEAQAEAAKAEAAQAEAVAADSAEVLKDFAAIAQAGPDEDADPDGEDGEEHYSELYEYLRVAAMNVLLDAGVGAPEEYRD